MNDHTTAGNCSVVNCSPIETKEEKERRHYRIVKLLHETDDERCKLKRDLAAARAEVAALKAENERLTKEIVDAKQERNRIAKECSAHGKGAERNAEVNALLAKDLSEARARLAEAEAETENLKTQLKVQESVMNERLQNYIKAKVVQQNTAAENQFLTAELAESEADKMKLLQQPANTAQPISELEAVRLEAVRSVIAAFWRN